VDARLCPAKPSSDREAHPRSDHGPRREGHSRSIHSQHAADRDRDAQGAVELIVDLIGYGSTTGEEGLFNEIGNFQGQTLMSSSLPRGSYLLDVQADGAWTIRFTA
jgi:hypothetical protein